MKHLLRFSISGLLGLVITATLFIGMLNLLSNQKKSVKSSHANIDFSFVKEYQETEEKEIKRPVKPEQQEITQAPAMPSMTPDTSREPGIDLPMPNTMGKNLNILAKVELPGMGTGAGHSGDHPGGIQSGIAPMYPQKALISKTEGWVQLLVDVNEFGRVSSVSVLKAKPARIFNASAIKNIKKWRFHPKVVDGKAMPYQVTQTVEFKLDQ